jgi:pseudo-rSAM protein
MNTDTKQKFLIYPHIYYTGNSESGLLLYNPHTGETIENDSPICRELVDEIYKPVHLGVIDLIDSYLNHPDVVFFIEEIVEKKFGKRIDIVPGMPKFINLLPVLNLQDDVERLKEDTESDVGEKSLCYLNELNIYLNNSCNLNCPHCPTYYQQTQSCHKGLPVTFIPFNKIKEVLDSLAYSPLKKVNFLGGNSLLYPHFNELTALLKDYDFDFHFWINIENLINANSDWEFKQEILVHFPTDMEAITTFIDTHKNDDRQTCHFLVEDENQYNVVMSVITATGFDRFQIVPVYIGSNNAFFEENVYLSKEDIFAFAIPHRIIFCNQKLNSNHFGKLYILPDGKIKANINASALGDIYQNSLLEIIAAEFNRNTAWRKIRDYEPCNQCLYQYLCPPPSNYEEAIGKPNLCHVHE